MSRATAEPLSVGLQRLKGSSDPPLEERPRDRGLRAQLAWLLVVVKVICLQNTNWLLSAGIHAAITLCIAGIAVHHHAREGGIGIEAGNFDGTGEGGFENVLGDDRPSGGGGTPFETTANLQIVEMSQQAGETAALNELARLGGQEGTDDGDGGEGGGRGGGSGTGTGRGKGPGIGLGAGFFGSKGKGKSFVYVVDCSGSMFGQRFVRAKSELVRSINKLTPEQKFYVYFFNDRTFPLFYPKPAKGMLPANKTNLQRASAWIRSRDPDSTTNPNLALQQALEMKPEVIFLLTDGELDDPGEVREMIKKFNKSNVVIHTIAFENEEGAVTLEAIAKENNGTFRFVR
ncbi:MAG TPA: VWA domain-containing protein [Planctomycetaceae bacterium]|nr:VWA domain-containing protein [Planctomycetaceae bacterium]